MTAKELDVDYIVVGSGFGGSVSAMRLSQKGYSVLVIEAGKKWNAEDFADVNWNVRKYLFNPILGCYGIQRMNFFRDVLILSGAGVGGGSLNYANTLYIPPDIFFEKASVRRLGGKDAILPYYQLAQNMLGAVTNPVMTVQDELIQAEAEEIGCGHTFRSTPVGVYFGKRGYKSQDPYFEGEGPQRIGCELCGKCMTGCKKDAKNTLDKNYLYFAERFGAQILPEHQVVDILPLSDDGSAGYQVRTKRTTGLFGKRAGKIFHCRGIVLSAGALGTINLLLSLKEKNRLPKLSDHIGKVVRTNSEVIVSAQDKSGRYDFSQGVAITSSVHLDAHTHIEPVRYAKGDDFMAYLAVLLTDGGGRIPRQIRYIMNIIKHPLDFLRLLYPFGWASRSLILLVMQTHDNYISLFRKRSLLPPFIKSLSSSQASIKRNPVYIQIANDFCRRLARRINGIPTSVITEVLMNAPLTAHIMGGCSISSSPEKDVIDEENRVKGYTNMIIADGSQIPENLGVNPALSITALSERAMSFIPPKEGEIHYLKAEKSWVTTDLLLQPSKHSGIQ